MDARQLQSFLAVIVHGTMTKAAEAMHVSPPSQAITRPASRAPYFVHCRRTCAFAGCPPNVTRSP
ncbi:LysR family transcriptional regulator [Saccharopolyspora sp. NPDC050389]|uniref:LysR family transcriptional regulator n=1 Tax=Saccharopolyspora sp. NPDC050389 TaxID=3155516 RepID=UPI0033FC9987